MKRETCAMQHFGVWLVEDRWFSTAVEAFRAGVLKSEKATNAFDEDDGLLRGPNGMAIVQLRGHLTKGRSSLGGTSSVEARRLVRQAAADKSVPGIMLFVDSPGGTAAGTFELAAEVRRARERKPVRAHIEDLGASAAYWVASQAERVTANTMAQVGSIGAVAILVDSSKAAEESGLKVHVISTGEFKGAGAPGAAVTRRQLEVFQEEIDDLNAHFLAGVAEGRGLSREALLRIASGRTWIASKASSLGLVDAVSSWEDAFGEFTREVGGRSADRRTAIALTEAELATVVGPLSDPYRSR